MENLIEQLCERHGIDQELVQNLLKLEKEHVFMGRRHNIVPKLKKVFEDYYKDVKNRDY